MADKTATPGIQSDYNALHKIEDRIYVLYHSALRSPQQFGFPTPQDVCLEIDCLRIGLIEIYSKVYLERKTLYGR